MTTGTLVKFMDVTFSGYYAYQCQDENTCSDNITPFDSCTSVCQTKHVTYESSDKVGRSCIPITCCDYDTGMVAANIGPFTLFEYQLDYELSLAD